MLPVSPPAGTATGEGALGALHLVLLGVSAARRARGLGLPVVLGRVVQERRRSRLEPSATRRETVVSTRRGEDGGIDV